MYEVAAVETSIRRVQKLSPFQIQFQQLWVLVGNNRDWVLRAISNLHSTAQKEKVEDWHWTRGKRGVWRRKGRNFYLVRFCLLIFLLLYSFSVGKKLKLLFPSWPCSAHYGTWWVISLYLSQPTRFPFNFLLYSLEREWESSLVETWQLSKLNQLQTLSEFAEQILSVFWMSSHHLMSSQQLGQRYRKGSERL